MNNVRMALLSLGFLTIFMFCSSVNHKVELKQQQEMARKLDAYMQALTQLNRFSGSVAVAKGDAILLNKGYGFASYEFDVPNSRETTFRIASISKMFTAVAIVQLHEKGLLNLKDPLNKYIPDYPRGTEITIHHLLTHTAGILGCNFPLEMAVLPTPLESIVSFFKDKPLESDPGADFHYSNGGYCILSYIIEKVSGKKFESYIKEHIAQPSGMAGTLCDYDYKIIKNYATGYCRNHANQIVQGDYSYTWNFSGAGGVCCTAYDLYKFAYALAHQQLISKDTLQCMISPYQIQQNYGYGCSIEKIHDHRCVFANGAMSTGFRSNVSLFIDDDVYIVILSNVVSSWVYDARDALASIMFDLPYDMPSSTVIKVDSTLYDDYVGIYDHPSYTSGLMVERRGDRLYLPESIELSPVGEDHYMALNRHADNMAYTFTRNEKGDVIQLRIKGGSPYYEIRCDKI